jgi:choline-glycine betaine transporter
VKKVVRWVIVVVVVVWVVQNPDSAAHLAHQIESWLSQAGRSLTTLTGNL